MPKFRPHLPENCPPASATPPNDETFYRFVLQEQVEARTFLSLDEEGKKCGNLHSLCEWGAVSLCRDEADLRIIRNQSKKFRTAKIAKGQLNTKDGVVRDSPTAAIRSHVSYWPYEGATPWTSFTIVAAMDADDRDG